MFYTKQNIKQIKPLALRLILLRKNVCKSRKSSCEYLKLKACSEKHATL